MMHTGIVVYYGVYRLQERLIDSTYSLRPKTLFIVEIMLIICVAVQLINGEMTRETATGRNRHRCKCLDCIWR